MNQITIEQLRRFQEITGVNPTIRRKGNTYETILQVLQPVEVDIRGMEQLRRLIGDKNDN